MAKYRAVIVGAGRIGAGFNWHDDAYTHAGAYKALSDRVELRGFVEPDFERAVTASRKWNVSSHPTIEQALKMLEPDIVSICTQPEDQFGVLKKISMVKGIWCEKPWASPKPEGKTPIQVNYLRRADPKHRELAAAELTGLTLNVIAKDDIHTRCHFEDLAKWWRVPLEYHAIKEGPCSYTLGSSVHEFFAFPNGGVDGGLCMQGMLGNLLDHIEGKAELWSPPA